MKLTNEMIIKGRSGKGGWNREQLKRLGVSWPPPKGWKYQIIGTEISTDSFEEFLKLGNSDKKPKPSGIEKEVCSDITERQQKGILKYGTTVADNPLELRAWLQHAYEETLDHAVYLKRAIAELDKSLAK